MASMTVNLHHGHQSDPVLPVSVQYFPARDDEAWRKSWAILNVGGIDSGEVSIFGSVEQLTTLISRLANELYSAQHPGVTEYVDPEQGLEIGNPKGWDHV